MAEVGTAGVGVQCPGDVSPSVSRLISHRPTTICGPIIAGLVVVILIIDRPQFKAARDVKPRGLRRFPNQVNRATWCSSWFQRDLPATESCPAVSACAQLPPTVNCARREILVLVRMGVEASFCARHLVGVLDQSCLEAGS